MRALVLLGIAVGIGCGTGTLTTPASAASAFLSRTGSGSACTQASPCININTAIAVAGAGGEVICLDKGDYAAGGIVNIGFAITISCGDGLWEAPHALVSISPPAGADVVIDGLVSDSRASPGNIVVIDGQGSVHLHRVRLGNNASDANFAIDFKPTGPAKLFVTDSFIYNTGASGVTGAILLKPASGVTANVTIERTRIENNRFGIYADGSAGGTIRGVVRDSVVSGNLNNGITANSSGAVVNLAVDNTTLSGNGFGLVAAGTNAALLVRRSFVTANATGLFTIGAGALFSYRDNSVNGNTTTDGAFTATIGTQ